MHFGRATPLLLGALLITLAILFALFWYEVPRGEQVINQTIDYARFSLIGGATYFGIISNGLYDRITAGANAPLFRKTDILFASIVAPVVILPIYKSLSDAADPVIIALAAYQNGFFFNVLFDKLRKGSAREK